MRKILKWTGILLLILVSGLAITTALRQNIKFDAPFPDIHASKDSTIIARGKYLVYGAAHCADCHAAVGTEARVDAGEEMPLSGGRVFPIPPGNIRARNLTPDETGIGNFKDEQIARSLRYGVGYDGRAIFDFMPFHNTSDADLVAIISYLRSTAPVKNAVPENDYSLLGKVLRAFLIKPTGPSMEVPKDVVPDSTVEYGKYLAVSVANCRGCHTDRDLKTGAFVGKDYAGGFTMESPINPKIIFHTPNISPDEKTGHIYNWTEDMFVKRFREGKKIKESPMPWGPFSRLDEKEIRAIYRFLRTVTPVERESGKIVEEVQ